jgi:hypothetical protein
VLEAEDFYKDLPPLLMFLLLFPNVSQPVIVGIMKDATLLLERSLKLCSVMRT